MAFGITALLERMRRLMDPIMISSLLLSLIQGQKKAEELNPFVDSVLLEVRFIFPQLGAITMMTLR